MQILYVMLDKEYVWKKNIYGKLIKDIRAWEHNPMYIDTNLEWSWL